MKSDVFGMHGYAGVHIPFAVFIAMVFMGCQNIGEMEVDEARGAVLAHSVKHPGGIFRKGRVLSDTDIAVLKENGTSSRDITFEGGSFCGTTRSIHTTDRFRTAQS